MPRPLHIILFEMQNFILVQFFLLFTLVSFSQENLHQVWICMATYHPNGGGMTYSGALLDLEDKNELVSGNVMSQYFKKQKYSISGKLIVGENDTIGKIVYLSKDLLKIKFYFGGDIGIYKPLKYKVSLNPAFESFLIQNSWQYWHSNIEKRIEFYDEIARDSYAPKICLRKGYDNLRNPFENRVWTLTNYKDYAILALSLTPATSEIFEITKITDNSFFANVIHKQEMIPVFDKCRNNKHFEKEFYAKLENVEVKAVSGFSQKEKEVFISKLESKTFQPIYVEWSGGGGFKRRNDTTSTMFLSPECVDNKMLNLIFNSNTLQIKDCNGVEYNYSFTIAPDGKYLILDSCDYSRKIEFPEIEFSNEKLSISFWLKVKSKEDRFEWKWCYIKFE